MARNQSRRDYNHYIILLYVQLLLSPSISSPIPTPSPSSLIKLGDLLFDQKVLFVKYPGKGDDDPLSIFQSCIKTDPNWNQANYIFSIEGEELSLPCTPCVPKNEPVFWERLSFEGEEQPLPQRGRNLTLKSVKPDLLHYYCYWKYVHGEKEVQMLSAMWTVEIAAIENLEKISARLWRKYGRGQVIPHQIPVFGGNEILEIGTNWSGWSECSKCGSVGKRHQVGFCSVGSPFRQPGTLSKFLALNIYKSPVSCSLFLDFHPEIVSDMVAHKEFQESQDQIHEFGRKHVILISYCKMTICRGWKGAGGLSKNDIIRKKLYMEFPMQGEVSKEQSAGERRIFTLLRNLTRGVPIGWSTLPELTVLVVLVSVQCYVVYLIAKSRKEAK